MCIFDLPHKVTTENYLKAFQYKVLNYIVYDNFTLKKIGISDSELCSFCKNYTDSVDHMLYLCPVVQDFWQQIEKLLNNITGENLLI